ncbi:hypothetical protein L3V77_24465 [Vibrio sp. DW001]|uniref:hypothetical protein n=1 Tax=Vibrio sp. DW001 TaxID=2912315 RepID=UPI0023AF1B8E|nr:hypothetical protein [Vibrio sp. DW001]WED29086.1 hypothetical protein L3V77_24465 [Vibrio sp. DW001]
MKRNSKTYRFQLIKDTAERHQRSNSADPMVRHIGHMLSEQPDLEENLMSHHDFAGHHYDQNIDGWVSDRWS